MKPIEPGCLAIIVGAVYRPERIGTVVKVVERTPQYDYVFRVPAWRIDIDSNNIAREDFLLRIDDYDASQDVVEENKETEKC